MKAMTKKQLYRALRASGVMFRTKAPKAELEKLFAEANVQTKPTPKKNKVGVKQVLRETFTRSGVVTSRQIDKIASKLSVQPATVRTAITDLKNAKYAGKAGPLNIEKDGDDYRLAK